MSMKDGQNISKIQVYCSYQTLSLSESLAL